MKKLTQRISDVAYRWTNNSIKELIAYKKSREVFEQIDLDIMENHIEFSTLYYCTTKYINVGHIEFIFGYRLQNKPDYFKKILYQLIFPENEFDANVIKKGLDALVDNIILCQYCDNGNLGVEEYNFACKHCYIYGTVNEEDSCAICLTNDFGVWLVTPCEHKFHYRCYNQMPDKFCPLCRKFTGNNTTLLDY